MLTPLPMPTSPPHPAVMPKHPAPLLAPFPMPVPHLAANSKHQVAHALSSVFNQLGHVRAVASLDNLSCIVVHYVREAALHDKLLEHSDMTLFERGVAPYGSAMVARECQPAAFALGTAIDPKEPRRYKPWDLGGPRRTLMRDNRSEAPMMAAEQGTEPAAPATGDGAGEESEGLE
ncbi:hypothetical protein GmHk_13G038186 [Glycine max]|nr:hypothetical protein GmHk_13G038186 [Glycine max]